MVGRRFRPRSAAKNNKIGCDNAGQPITEKTPQGEVYLEMTAIPKSIQEMADAMFREAEKDPEAKVANE